jgi:hypothetical protein
MQTLSMEQVEMVSGGRSTAGLGASMLAGGFSIGVAGAEIGAVLGTALFPGAGTVAGGAAGAALGATLGSVIGAVVYLSK